MILNIDFSNCKNGIEFMKKNNLTFDEALRILDIEIDRLKQEIEINKLEG